MLADTKALENLCTSRRCWGVDLPVRWHVWLEKMEIGVEVPAWPGLCPEQLILDRASISVG